MKLTPAKDFAKSPLAKGWLDVVSESQFQEAAKAALLECGREAANDPNGALKMRGAMDFLDKLMTLGETQPVIQRKDTVNLT